MIQDIAPHTYHNEYKPSAPDTEQFYPCLRKRQYSSSTSERKQIFIFHVSDLEEKVSDLYSKYIYLFSIDDQRFYLIPELIPPFFQIMNSRCMKSSDSPATASGVCRSYRTSAFPVVQQAPVLRLLWETNAAQPKRTYDGMPFLRQSGVPCPVSCSNRRNHKRR